VNHTVRTSGFRLSEGIGDVAVLDESGRDDAHELWARLPPEAVAMVVSHIGPMTDHVVRDIRRSLPEYERAADQVARTAGRAASVFQRFLAAMGRPAPGPEATRDWVAMLRETGRQEFHDGRSLDGLHSAYRVAGRSCWRYLSDVAQREDLPPELICLVAEALFASIDETCSLTVSGYSEEHARSGGATDPQRARLLILLLGEPPPTQPEIGVLAEAARWPVPETAVAVALGPPGEHDPALTLDDAVLRDLDGTRPCLVTGDPDTHLAGLGARLGRRRAAIGPVVPLTEVGWSLALARRALVLADRGVPSDQPVLHCSDHLVDLMLVADPALVTRLTERALAPFGELPERQRDRLEHTLLTWLRSRGNVVEAADRLAVHPQTVRYRMRQISDLLGAALDGAESRFALEAVLRANRLLGRGPEGDPTD
jgi:PucR C-terminal helix-turn-helix domain